MSIINETIEEAILMNYQKKIPFGVCIHGYNGAMFMVSQHLPNEIGALCKDCDLPKDSLHHVLHPFLDSAGLLDMQLVPSLTTHNAATLRIFIHSQHP